jgi:hypothetical protein
MRYFLCTLGGFSLGIPENSAAAVVIYSEAAGETISHEEGGDILFSLPHFFALADRRIRHGIALKSPEGEEGGGAPRQVLLVGAVEKEVDIASRDIYPLPELFLAPGRFPFFTGISFMGPVMIAIVDPAVLITQILQDTEGGPASRACGASGDGP